LRYNELAEVTRCHSCHGDTEYRYTFSGQYRQEIVDCQIRCQDNTWKTIFKGSVFDFINKFSTDGVQWKKFSKNNYDVFYSKEKAERELKNHMENAGKLLYHCELDNINVVALKREIDFLKKILKEF